MTRKSSGRKKKTGKFTPLIWLLTGALIAFFISYSNVFVNNQNSASPTNQSNSRNLQSIASNFFNNRNNKTDANPANPTLTNPAFADTPLTNIAPVQSRQVKLFFAKQLDDIVKIVPMTYTISNSPTLLEDTINLLLNARELTSLFNLIPYNAKINKIWIENGIAYIDFDENFNFNSYGVIGYKIQIYQIVYTATQFSSITAVYFYMNGKPLEYLGGEGYLIHNPIYPFSSLPEFSI